MTTDIAIAELTADTLVAVRANDDGDTIAETIDGRNVSHLIRKFVRDEALRAGNALRFVPTKTGGFQWRKAEMTEFTAARLAFAKTAPIAPAVTPDANDVAAQVAECYRLKPESLVLSELKWKFLFRSVLRGKNLLMTGPSGAGKTLTVQTIAKALKDRPYYYFNLGATQDPRTALIGNTHFKHDEGTCFGDSLFVEAIQTPNAIILLDELSRAHPEAANILMTVLDYNQRYLRIDEKMNTPTISVAPGVCFIATANIGAEYTAARVMDRALLERFTRLEMDLLNVEQEFNLLKLLFPKVDETQLKALAEIAGVTRKEVKTDAPHVRQEISTRLNVEAASALADGFTLAEVAEAFIYPYYDAAGGTESERVFMQQNVQKYLPTVYDGKEQPVDTDIPENKLPFNIT